MGIFNNLFNKYKNEDDKSDYNQTECINTSQVLINPDIVANRILDDWDLIDFSEVDTSTLDPKVLLVKIEKKDIENNELRMEVSYYKRYLKFLDDNFIFISKSTKNIQDIFDKIGEADE